MGSEGSGDKVFQQRGMVDTNSNSDKVSGLESIFYSSNWESIMPQSEFANPLMLENQTMSSSLVQFPFDSGLVDLVPRIPTFGSGSFSEMATSNLPHKKAVSHGFCPNSYGKRKREVKQGASSPKNAEEEQKDPSGDTSEFPKDDEEKKQIFEKNIDRGKQVSKQAMDNSSGAEPSKDDYIHVRAKRGHATNSHSLAERVRRERISERMRLLQELVPGCNKITGKALMLDEIINYVQSLQQQVEFLSMKLATVNPELNMDIDRILSKDILHLRGNNANSLGITPGLSSSLPFPLYPQGIFNNATSTTAFHSLPQHVWNNEVQSLLQMGFDPDSPVSMGQNGLSKMEL